MSSSARPEPDHQLERERWEALGQVVTLLEGPMTVLGFVWLGIVVAELAGTAGPLLSRVGTLIWILFLLDFFAELLVAPRRGQYLRQHWLAAVSLAVPALRILRFVSLVRVARAARLVGASRGLRLLRLVTSFNRGMQALRRSMARRGFQLRGRPHREVASGHAASRRYEDDSLVLSQEFETGTGRVRVVDFMPPRGSEPDLVRIVEGVSGSVRMEMELAIRFDYGSIVPWVRRIDDMLLAIGGPDALSLWTPARTGGAGFDDESGVRGASG